MVFGHCKRWIQGAVWIADRDSEAVVVNQNDVRSYQVESEDGTYRRNKVIVLPEQDE